MNKTLKRILSAGMAAALLLGLMTTALAAVQELPGDTGTIVDDTPSTSGGDDYDEESKITFVPDTGN